MVEPEIGLVVQSGCLVTQARDTSPLIMGHISGSISIRSLSMDGISTEIVIERPSSILNIFRAARSISSNLSALCVNAIRSRYLSLRNLNPSFSFTGSCLGGILSKLDMVDDMVIRDLGIVELVQGQSDIEARAR